MTPSRPNADPSPRPSDGLSEGPLAAATTATRAARADRRARRTFVRRLIPAAGPVTANQIWRCLILLFAAAAISLTRGFHEPIVPVWVADACKGAFLFIYWLNLVTSAPGVAGRVPLSAAPLRALCKRLRIGSDDRPFPPRTPGGLARIDLALILIAAAGLALNLSGRTVSGEYLIDAVVCAALAGELWRLNVLLSRTLPSPGVLLPLSFLFLIAVGTLMLKLPVCIEPGRESLSWVDSLFTMTSATCVTGLTVRSTAHDFSTTGQTVIIAFVQMGGLGIILFGSTLAFLMTSGGGRGPNHADSSLREKLTLSQMLSDQPLHTLTRFARFVVLTALTIELLGALALYALWPNDAAGPMPAERRLGLAAFHAISAFCNAGFDLTGSSLEAFRLSPIAHLVIAPLIVLGGLGFPVLRDVGGLILRRTKQVLRRISDPANPRRYPAHKQRLTLHSRLVLITSLALYLVGLVVIFAGQITPHWRADDAPPSATPALTSLADASFLSISARTAGFNSLTMSDVEPPGRFALMALMLVGGAPGSVAGGVKVTVLAVLVLSVVATIYRRPETEALGRTIADSLVRTAGTIGLCYFALVAATTTLLTLTESQPFEILLFEAISASTTTGLSLGVTPNLSTPGKLVIIAAMFLGRIGPLALLGSIIFTRPRPRRFTYAHEHVTLG